ncbi:MAG: transposase, partial [Anaerolineae bacterium]|nr:transposase [Anaerolineae bacterium]
KRHIVTDTLGLLLIVLVHSASLQDGAGGLQVLHKLFETIKRSVHNRWCRLKLLWAAAAYISIVEKVRKVFGWKLDIVRRSDKVKGFEVLPHRWIVERTFGWLGRYRRLARDFEHTVSSSASVVDIASIRRMLKLATN